ncbi:MAG TPA: endonuclease/exonuclease/phosphatase family protein [Ignavibacteriaceae bacterium]|nr:endonuclease/exonuclease/phosphatase family protein [Ignavibacteriaceae bacterium]
MTYNIRFAGDEKVERENSWNNRKEPIVSIIKTYKADIIGLQEALKIQLDDLVKMLPHFSFVGEGREGGEEGEYSAILFNKKRFEVLEDTTIWLSDTPEKPSRGWDAAYNRVITWVKFKEIETGKAFYLFNTHFDHVGVMAQLESADLLNDKVAEIAGKTPAIVTGDFNFKSDSKGYKILTGGRRNFLIDSQIEKENPNITFNDFGKYLEEGNKIDYIFIKNEIEILKHKIINDKFEGRFPSDHMPVLAELQIK